MFNGSTDGGSRRRPTKDGMEEYSGSRTLRFLQFWSRAIAIYHDYKVSQVRREGTGLWKECPSGSANGADLI